MQDKQKITLYISPSLHRQLKIRSAIDSESMSAVVEQAVNFYLQYPEVVEETKEKVHGRTHQVHICPECNAALVEREGEMISLKNQPGVIDEEFPLEKIGETVTNQTTKSQEQEKLVHC
jgi:uncharacterized protein with PIN domain